MQVTIEGNKTVSDVTVSIDGGLIDIKQDGEIVEIDASQLNRLVDALHDAGHKLSGESFRSIDTRLNIGHARVVATILAGAIRQGANDIAREGGFTTEEYAALRGLSSATAGPLWGDPIRDAIAKVEAWNGD